jgi:hypothetical protein
MQKKLFQKIQD